MSDHPLPAPDHRKWSEGDEVTYVTGYKRTIFPGLFFYSGLGMGHLYAPEGKIYWCSSEDAHKLCTLANVKYEFKDSFDGYRATALGDR